uniref:ACYPI001235 protein n=1 Tax=Acyrthosiphon pisum TaxID=7029 RepID=C4WXN6_ACYPI|nr:ACYPI001235 [Acyrthosiphon pisum]
MEFLMLFIFNTFTLAMSNHIKLIPELCKAENFKQLGTFFYANITPQWESINQHVWALIESAIRSYAMDNDKKLEAYAGTHGQAMVDGQPLFLTGDGRMPVAAWLWKAAVDRSTGAGIAFVCSNDPFKRAASPPCGDMDVCVDGHWHAAVVVGWSFCCTLQQLVETVPGAATAIVDGAGMKLLKRQSPATPPMSPDSAATMDDDEDDEDDDDDDDGDDEAEKDEAEKDD